MTNRSETFGRLLKGAINSIAAYEGKTAPVVEDELGAQIGVTGGSIQRYKAGYLPPEPRPVQILAEAGVRRGFLARAWLVRFLQAARYPTPEPLIASLADALGAPAAPPAGGLPGGTVALLFTDIAGSTQRWEAQPRAMERALERHDAILRQAIDSYGGHTFKTVGDAFCAVFTTVPAALEAALSAQRALRAESWGPAGPLAVRMAIHVGAPQQRDGDYFGPSLNRVARILSAGHGGQVLLSLSAQELACDLLPPGVALRDLGAHRLKDLGRPERVYQAEAPELPADFPPLRSLDAYRHNLPPQATALIGREAEVERVRELLSRDETRLLTLVGPGGIGKTRLALQAAAELLDEYRDGATFVALAPLRDPAHVPAAIAQALGLPEVAELPVAEQLKHALGPRQALLVLDNFEQVVAAAPLIGELLAAAPRVKALVTSREALHLYGEQEYNVPPLALPEPGPLLPIERLAQVEAVRLFVERAQAVRPDFAVTAETAPLIAEICSRLDGLPLAIELAAARSKLFPPKALLARLDSRLRTLVGGPRDLPARQQTLAGAIAWSYDLLDITEQTIFARLGVFAGGCTLEMAEAVLSDDGATDEVAAYVPTDAVVGGISSLIDRSLVRQVAGAGDDVRIVMLETIREFAQERLAASGEQGALRARHARAVAELVERAEPLLRGPEQVAWLARLEAEHANIRAALGWGLGDGDATVGLRIAGACVRFWSHRNHAREGIGWLERGLAAAPGAPAELRARALAGIVWHSTYNLLTMTLPHIDEALALCEAVDDWAGLAMCQAAITQVASMSGETPEAILAKGAATVASARRSGDAALLAELLAGFAGLSYSMGDPAGGARAAREALAVARQVGAPRLLAEVLWRCAYDVQAGMAQRGAWIVEAEGLAREVDDPSLLALIINNRGELAREAGDLAQAARHYQAAQAMFQDHGLPQFVGLVCFNLGQTAISQGDLAAAVAHYRAGLQISRAAEARHFLALNILGLGQAAALDGRAEGAAHVFGALGVHMPTVVIAHESIADAQLYERAAAAARAGLGEEGYAAACGAGAALSWDELVAAAEEL